MDAARARLVALGVEEGWAEALVGGADAAHVALGGWRDVLTPEDTRELVASYHRAETLARYALEAALDQAPERYRAELREQIADEDRHIDLFAAWLGDVDPVPRPKIKTREPFVWFALLLVNEIAGYCQFRMLQAVAPDEHAEAEVSAVMIDEEVHIARLLRWLAPVWGAPRGRIARGLVGRFRRDLEGRMCQFFPRNDLNALRVEVARAIDRPLAALPGCAS